jgi:hypothetical protein
MLMDKLISLLVNSKDHSNSLLEGFCFPSQMLKLLKDALLSFSSKQTAENIMRNGEDD